jgi:hypothetical protein
MIEGCAMTGLWRTWMILWCWGVALFGVVLALGGFPATSGPTQFLLDTMYTGGAATLDAPLRFGVGIQGALSIGLALTIYGAVRAGDLLGPRSRPVWEVVVAALIAWFVIDSGISIFNGFALNAASNALLMAGFLVPVLASGVLRRNT